MWDGQQADNVRGLLTQFNGAEEVCAVMGCEEGELDGLCLAAFSMDFATAKATFSAQGRAMVRRTLMQQALDGNMKALDMLAREQLGMGAVETRRRVIQGDEEAKDAADGDDDFLAQLIARRKGGQPGAEDPGRA